MVIGYKVRNWALKAMAVIWLALPNAFLRAQISEGDARTQPAAKEDSHFAKGRVILKFRDSFNADADYLFKRKLPFKEHAHDRSTQLDQFFAEVNAKSIRKLVAQTGERLNHADTRREFFEHTSRIKSKFGARSARALKEPAVDLSHLYVLEFAGGQEMEEVLARLRSSEDIEYAHPDPIFQADLATNDPQQSGAQFINAPEASSPRADQYSRRHWLRA